MTKAKSWLGYLFESVACTFSVIYSLVAALFCEYFLHDAPDTWWFIGTAVVCLVLRYLRVDILGGEP